jgi:hypothetical protein
MNMNTITRIPSLLLLDNINRLLASLNLKTLTTLGDTKHGQIEITGMPDVFDHSKRFFYDLKFPVLFPNGNHGFFTARWNANNAVSDGAIFLVLLNGKVAVVKQWRLPLCKWTFEIPRGFGEKLDNAKINGKLGTIQLADLPIATAFRELGEEVANNIRITSISHLGNVATDSGTTVNTPSVYLVKAVVPDDKLAEAVKSRSDDETKVQFWTPKQLWDEVGGNGKIADIFSITAIALLRKDIESINM